MSDAAGRRPRVSLTVLAAILALVTGGVSLLFTLKPDLTPDPRTRLGATIRSVAVDRRVRREEFIKALAPGDERRQRELEDEAVEDYLAGQHVSPAQMRQARETKLHDEIGSIVYAQTEGQGLKNKTVDVYWWVYDAHGKRQYGGGSDTVTLKAPSDSFIVPTFVYDLPPCTAKRFVRLELRDENGTLIAMSTTKPFRSCPLHR